MSDDYQLRILLTMFLLVSGAWAMREIFFYCILPIAMYVCRRREK